MADAEAACSFQNMYSGKDPDMIAVKGKYDLYLLVIDGSAKV